MIASAGGLNPTWWMLHSPRMRVLISLVCLLVLASGLFRQIMPQPFNGVDFVHAYEAAVAVRDGHNPYEAAAAWIQNYKPGDLLENHLDFYTYAPTYALLLVPLTLLPYQAALTLWGLCIAAFLFLAIYALLRSTGVRPSLTLLLVLVTAESLTTAVRAEVFLGQANLFLVACVCTAIWVRQERRPGLAGLLLALALVTKPTLLIIVFFLLWKREFKFAFVSVAGFIGLLLLPFAWLGGQTAGDLLIVWRFFSSQYLTFTENVAPRGMLERLFTSNPFVHPIVVAPPVATLLWLAVVATLLLLTLAVVSPRPMQRDNRSLLEVGMIVSALLLISPLTEPPYLVWSIVPMVASVVYLQTVTSEPGRPRFGWAAIVVLVIWCVELVPRSYLESFFWARAVTDSLVGSVYATLAPSQFYILVTIFVLQLLVLRRAAGISIGVAVRDLVLNSPQLGWEWVMDLARALNLSRRSSASSSLDRTR
jgi:hypothetical protein